MRYTLPSGKAINIPDKEIESCMKNLEMSKEEAIEMWLEDNEYLENEEQDALTKKVLDSGIMRTIHEAQSVDKTQKTQAERVRKENPTKALLIQELFAVIEDMAENASIVKKEKLIEFDFQGNHYKLDLIQQRPPKKPKE